jgi:putative ATP-binding cassette transporter
MPMKLLRYAARFEKRTLVVAAIASAISGALSAATLAIVAGVLQSGRPGLPLILGFVGLAVAGAVMRFISTEMLTRFSQRQWVDMGRDLSRRVLASGLRNVEELGAPRLIATFTEDMLVVAQTLTLLPNMTTQVAIFLVCVGYVAWLSWQVWLISTICIVLGLVLYAGIARRAGAMRRDARDEQDRLMGSYHALSDGFTELKLHRPRRDAFLTRGLGRSLDRIAQLNIASAGLFNIAGNYHQLLFFAIVGIMVFGTTRWVGASMSTITGAILALLYGRGPLEALVNWVPMVMRAEIALSKYQSVLDRLPPEEHAPAGRASAFERGARIDLNGIEYRYTADDGSQFTLGPIDLSMQAGEIVFVTGENGSGKSTLAKIIAGLYEPSAGRMSVDGVAVTNGNRDDYRQLVSSVFPAFHLFKSLLGLERPTLDREAAAWLARLRLTERVRVENGVFSDLRLSTGQRKRIALLVAMLEARPVCIFDEWAADQDAFYREEFYGAVLPELKAHRKLVVVISHDDRYFSLADRLITLERGRVVGDHAMAKQTVEVVR